jgi:hypothetical protein
MRVSDMSENNATVEESGETTKRIGRAAGTPNKATSKAREAISLVAEGMAPKFTDWLTQVAEGVRREPTKKEVEEGKEGPFWLIKPNPDAAANTYLRAIEYHIPKLARTEVDHSGSVTVNHEQWIDGLK